MAAFRRGGPVGNQKKAEEVLGKSVKVLVADTTECQRRDPVGCGLCLRTRLAHALGSAPWGGGGA